MDKTTKTTTGEDLDKLEALAKAATPQNFDSAQITNQGCIECPSCDGSGEVELTADYCNYDGRALGVQFYGIGPEHRAAEAFYRAANPAAILELIALARAGLAAPTGQQAEPVALALRYFLGAAYTVDTTINPRGYNWSEAYLDQARAAAMEALSAPVSTAPVSAAPAAPTELHTLRRLIECAEELDKRPRPMCRDCADENGTCPNSKLECDMGKLFADAKRLHNRLAAPAATAEPMQAGAVADIILDLIHAQYVLRYDTITLGDEPFNSDNEERNTLIHHIEQTESFKLTAPTTHHVSAAPAVPTDWLSEKVLNAMYTAFQRGDSVERAHKAVMGILAAPTAAEGPSRPTDDHLWDETIRDRDTYQGWADKLADAIAKHFGAEIGEHSNMNCPWAEALDVIENAAPLPTKEGAGEVDAKPVERIKLRHPLDGAELVRDGSFPNWILMRGNTVMRYLDQFERNFVNSAIDAAIAAQPKDTTDTNAYRAKECWPRADAANVKDTTKGQV